MTEEDRKELSDLIATAEASGKWLHCRYQDIWMPPAKLREANADGRFLWGVVNWTLRDPRQKLEQMKKAEKAATQSRERLERELQNPPQSDE